MARNTKQQTISESNHKYTPDHQAIFGMYAEMIEHTTDSLSTYLINMHHLLDTSEEGAFRLLRLICDKYNFIVNDMNRELEGKHPFDGIRLEGLDFSEEFKQEHPHFFQTEGGK